MLWLYSSALDKRDTLNEPHPSQDSSSYPPEGDCQSALYLIVRSDSLMYHSLTQLRPPAVTERTHQVVPSPTRTNEEPMTKAATKERLGIPRITSRPFPVSSFRSDHTTAAGVIPLETKIDQLDSRAKVPLTLTAEARKELAAKCKALPTSTDTEP